MIYQADLFEMSKKTPQSTPYKKRPVTAHVSGTKSSVLNLKNTQKKIQEFNKLKPSFSFSSTTNKNYRNQQKKDRDFVFDTPSYLNNSQSQNSFLNTSKQNQIKSSLYQYQNFLEREQNLGIRSSIRSSLSNTRPNSPSRILANDESTTSYNEGTTRPSSAMTCQRNKQQLKFGKNNFLKKNIQKYRKSQQSAQNLETQQSQNNDNDQIQKKRPFSFQKQSENQQFNQNEEVLYEYKIKTIKENNNSRQNSDFSSIMSSSIQESPQQNNNKLQQKQPKKPTNQNYLKPKKQQKHFKNKSQQFKPIIPNFNNQQNTNINMNLNPNQFSTLTKQQLIMQLSASDNIKLKSSGGPKKSFIQQNKQNIQNNSNSNANSNNNNIQNSLIFKSQTSANSPNNNNNQQKSQIYKQDLILKEQQQKQQILSQFISKQLKCQNSPQTMQCLKFNNQQMIKNRQQNNNNYVNIIDQENKDEIQNENEQINKSPDKLKKRAQLINPIQNKFIGSYDQMRKMQSIFLESLKNPEQKRQSFDMMFQFLQSFLDNVDSFLFCKCLIFCGDMADNIDEQNKSLFFFFQAKLLADNFKELSSLKSIIFYRMGDILREMQQYEIAIKSYLRGLQYSFYYNQKYIEIEIYEKMGLCYYYLGKGDIAKILHQRAMIADLEAPNSKARKFNIDIINTYIRTNQNYTQKFKSSFQVIVLNNLHLPLKLDQSCLENLSQYYRDKEINYQNKALGQRQKLFYENLNQNMLINQIKNDNEMNQLIEYPNHPVSKDLPIQQMVSKVRTKINPIFNKIDYDVKSLGIINDRVKNVNDYNYYKLDLDKQVEIRLQKHFDQDEIIQKIHENISEQKRTLCGERRSRVKVTHMAVNRKTEKQEKHIIIIKEKKTELLYEKFLKLMLHTEINNKKTKLKSDYKNSNNLQHRFSFSNPIF